MSLLLKKAIKRKKMLFRPFFYQFMPTLLKKRQFSIKDQMAFSLKLFNIL